MMQVLNNPQRTEWKAFLERQMADATEQKEIVKAILSAVKKDGDAALRKFAAQFDGTAPESFRLSDEETAKAGEQVSEDLRKAILQAAANIRSFHSSGNSSDAAVETMPGVTCWKKNVPIDTVGLYIPGGTAPLFSTVLMLGIPAQIAGCRKVVLCTPAKNGLVHPAILFAAKVAGINEIYGVGGAQAIAALAYGTASIPRVDKIFGPGNSYVTLAKQMVQMEGVAIDLPAGPSELFVLASEGAEPSYIAADLLSQAEHGADSQVILVSVSETLVSETIKEVEKQLEALPRKDLASRSLSNSRAVVVNDLTTAMEMVNEYAPEHLLLIGDEAESKVYDVRNAGSVFIGPFSPEAAGDYATGTNHTLPTSGYARACSGVNTGSFQKTISYQRLTKKGLESISGTVITMAREEGLEGHARSISVRLEK